MAFSISQRMFQDYTFEQVCSGGLSHHPGVDEICLLKRSWSQERIFRCEHRSTRNFPAPECHPDDCIREFIFVPLQVQ